MARRAAHERLSRFANGKNISQGGKSSQHPEKNTACSFAAGNSFEKSIKNRILREESQVLERTIRMQQVSYGLPRRCLCENVFSFVILATLSASLVAVKLDEVGSMASFHATLTFPYDNLSHWAMAGWYGLVKKECVTFALIMTVHKSSGRHIRMTVFVFTEDKLLSTSVL